MSKDLLFLKYCENEKSGSCTPTALWKRKLVPKGDGYIQKCPVCGWEWDPESGMTMEEKNQLIIDSCISLEQSYIDAYLRLWLNFYEEE